MKTEKKYLVTCYDWFYAPDGEVYKAVWGEIEIFEAKETLGFIPRQSTNWYIKVDTVYIAGCQIHYLIECLEKPTTKKGTYIDKDTKRTLNCNNIYIP